MAEPAGFFLAIIFCMFAGIVYGGYMGIKDCMYTPPVQVCKDYTYTLSRFRADIASCSRNDMTMRLEKRIIGADIVYCTCNYEEKSDDGI